MGALKGLAEADVTNIFINLDEFAEEHVVDGVLLNCVLDHDIHVSRNPEIGVEAGDLRLFASAEELGERREADDVMDIDGTLYRIVSYQVDEGLAQVQLSSSRVPY